MRGEGRENRGRIEEGRRERRWEEGKEEGEMGEEGGRGEEEGRRKGRGKQGRSNGIIASRTVEKSHIRASCSAVEFQSV